VQLDDVFVVQIRQHGRLVYQVLSPNCELIRIAADLRPQTLECVEGLTLAAIGGAGECGRGDGGGEGGSALASDEISTGAVVWLDIGVVGDGFCVLLGST